MPTARLFAIVPAAGVGRRMTTNRPKQYLDLAGKPVLEHTLTRLLQLDDLQTIVVALAANDQHWPSVAISHHPRIQTVTGGKQRHHSVLHALQALPANHDDWVFVHDAVRPCIQPTMIEQLIKTVADDAVGGLLAIPVTDTIKRVKAHHVMDTIDRRTLWQAQTPQLFRYGLLLHALTDSLARNYEITDEASAIEHLGKQPKILAGSINNIKITHPEDLIFAEHYLTTQPATTSLHHCSTQPPITIGHGYDVHRFGDGDHLILGGVTIPYHHGMVAHSDGDVVLHALSDAILGACNLGDIGQHFPDTDPQYANADSRLLLRQVCRKMQAYHWQLSHADITIIAQAPPITPHKDTMRQNIADDLQADSSMVNIKATTPEGLGPIGRQEGMAVHAVVLLRKNNDQN